MAFERDARKVEYLARQRPQWSVYRANCEHALAAGAGAHLTVNLLDVDPYGDPWPVIDAFLMSDRPRPTNLVIAVNDGLRQSLAMKRAWNIGSLKPMVQLFGNDLYHDYIDVCREMMTLKATQSGYSLSRFVGYYAGEREQMTHYLAVLVNEV